MSLPLKHAAAIGAVTGGLSGAAISLVMGISFPEALERIVVLAFAAMLGATILVWLDQGLRKATEHSKEQPHQ